MPLVLIFRLLAIQEHFDATRSPECGHLLTLRYVHRSRADRPWPRPMDVHKSLDVFGDLYKAHVESWAIVDNWRLASVLHLLADLSLLTALSLMVTFSPKTT